MLGQPADGAASAGPAVRVLETAAARESEEAAAGGDCLGSDYSTRIFCINLVGLLYQLCYSSVSTLLLFWSSLLLLCINWSAGALRQQHHAAAHDARRRGDGEPEARLGIDTRL